MLAAAHLRGLTAPFKSAKEFARAQGSAAMFLPQGKGISLIYLADSRQQAGKPQVPGEQKADLKD